MVCLETSTSLQITASQNPEGILIYVPCPKGSILCRCYAIQIFGGLVFVKENFKHVRLLNVFLCELLYVGIQF